ncbi:unnamed protein product [Acanthoscelides obtectus]|uniref:Uncharacterized protein n=1 Tax=Acanthoscelides obtectus TaxID=200917 RepID=A0A9P0JQ47_ACAOB|nr:unnamed protein product [Acanthoscelides obtectus]CAK1658116.1 hypothetical protein AOBTE_LOCUS20700 [Acanthoscelides obtectus]
MKQARSIRSVDEPLNRILYIIIASLASQESVRIYEGFHFFLGVEYFKMHITLIDNMPQNRIIKEKFK